MTIGEAINSVIKKANGKGIISVEETIKLLHQEVKSQEDKDFIVNCSNEKVSEYYNNLNNEN